MKRQSQNPIHIRDDVLNEVPCIPRNEEEMIADSKRASDDMYCTADIQGWLAPCFKIRDLIANWVVRIAFTPTGLTDWRALLEKHTR